MAYSERVVDAFAFAARAHAGQVRKGSDVPYVTHVMAVAAIVGESGGDEDAVIAALLHDVVEDQPVTVAEIEQRFGRAVADIVEACSDATTRPKPPWRERKERYVAHLRTASPSVRLVSAADKLHNARAIARDVRALGPALWARFGAPKNDIAWYYRRVLDALADGWDHAILHELAQAVAEVERCASQE